VQEALWRGHELSTASGTGRCCAAPLGPNAATMIRHPCCFAYDQNLPQRRVCGEGHRLGTSLRTSFASGC
jgi:hypothetical protein